MGGPIWLTGLRARTVEYWLTGHHILSTVLARGRSESAVWTAVHRKKSLHASVTFVLIMIIFLFLEYKKVNKLLNPKYFVVGLLFLHVHLYSGFIQLLVLFLVDILQQQEVLPTCPDHLQINQAKWRVLGEYSRLDTQLHSPPSVWAGTFAWTRTRPAWSRGSCASVSSGWAGGTPETLSTTRTRRRPGQSVRSVEGLVMQLEPDSQEDSFISMSPTAEVNRWPL